jgi:hypothetical protein
MVMLNGYDGRFGLRWWSDADRGHPPYETCSDDLEVLRARAEALVAAGQYRRIELLAWSFELNDWVRLETFEAD